MTTYTEDEVKAAVDAAVAELVSQVAAYESAAQNSTINAHIAQLEAEHEAVVVELQAKLDKAQLKKQAAVDELESYKANLQALADAAAHDAEITARTEQRVARVKEVASFPEDYLEENKARFAAMSDEDFETALKDYATVSKPAGESGIPKTALTASRESGSTTNNDRSLLREMMRDSLVGIDPRTL